MRIEEGVALARFTTLGTGGPARAFARPGTLGELEDALAWATERGLAVATVGLGSNLLVADDGVDALVLKLTGELASAGAADDVVGAGGGAPLAVCLHRARAAELGGLEFACAIPGTAGGAVWMNAGAYGGDISGVLARALVAEAGRTARWLSPGELGLEYRRSKLRHGQVVARVELKLQPRPGAEIKATVAQMQARRKASQPTNKRTFGSVFKNPEGRSAGALLEACGLKGFRRGGAQVSPRHANFIENADGARSADALALMAEGRRRVLEEFGIVLEHEVALLGELELPPAGGGA